MFLNSVPEMQHAENLNIISELAKRSDQIHIVRLPALSMIDPRTKPLLAICSYFVRKDAAFLSNWHSLG